MRCSAELERLELQHNSETKLLMAGARGRMDAGVAPTFFPPAYKQRYSKDSTQRRKWFPRFMDEQIFNQYHRYFRHMSVSN